MIVAATISAAVASAAQVTATEANKFSSKMGKLRENSKEKKIF